MSDTTAPRLTDAQGRIVAALLCADGWTLSVDELADKADVGNVGALQKALRSLGLVRVNGRQVTFTGGASSAPFVNYDPSGLGINMRRKLRTKTGAARFAATLIRTWLGRSNEAALILDAGTTQAHCFQELAKLILDEEESERSQFKLYCINPVIVAELLTLPRLFDVHVVGGELDYAKTSFEDATITATVEEIGRKCAFDFAVVGVARASTEGKLGQPQGTVVGPKRAIVLHSSNVLVLMDDSKIIPECSVGSEDILDAAAKDDNEAEAKLFPSTIRRIFGVSTRNDEPRRNFTLTIVIAVPNEERDQNPWTGPFITALGRIRDDLRLEENHCELRIVIVNEDGMALTDTLGNPMPCPMDAQQYVEMNCPVPLKPKHEARPQTDPPHVMTATLD